MEVEKVAPHWTEAVFWIVIHWRIGGRLVNRTIQENVKDLKGLGDRDRHLHWISTVHRTLGWDYKWKEQLLERSNPFVIGDSRKDIALYPLQANIDPVKHTVDNMFCIDQHNLAKNLKL